MSLRANIKLSRYFSFNRRTIIHRANVDADKLRFSLLSLASSTFARYSVFIFAKRRIVQFV